MNLFNRLGRGKSQPLAMPTNQSKPDEPEEQVPVLPAVQVAAPKVDSGGVPIWMLGVALAIVFILVGCIVLVLLSEPATQEVVVVVQPTAVLKPDQPTLVVKANQTPVKPSRTQVSQAEEEGGGLPVGGILVFSFVVLIITIVLFAVYWKFYNPLLVVPVGQQFYITDQRKGTVRVQTAGWTIVKKPVETVSGPFNAGVISLPIPQRIVLMKPTGAAQKNIEGEIRIRLDLMVQYIIVRLGVMAEKVEGDTPQSKIMNLEEVLKDIIVSLMETVPHEFEVGQWDEFVSRISNRASRPFSIYGIEVAGVRILNRDYADKRVQDAQDAAAIQVAKAEAERSAATMDGNAIRQWLRAAGVKGRITPEQVALAKQVLGGKGLLEGLLTSNMLTILQALVSKGASVPVVESEPTVLSSRRPLPDAASRIGATEENETDTEEDLDDKDAHDAGDNDEEDEEGEEE